MEPDRSTSDGQELDRLLAKAQWPEPGAERMAQLGEHWQMLRQARRRRLAAYGAFAMAASVLVVAGIAVWRAPSTVPEQRLAAEPESNTIESPPPSPEPPASNAVAKHELPQPQPAVGQRARDPSLYEQAVLLSAFPKLTPRREASPNAQPSDAAWDELIAKLADDPEADIELRLAELQADLPRFERLLWKAVRHGDGKRRLGAARLLARVGTPRSLPVLMELVGNPAMREAAVLGLARLVGPQDLARLAAVEPEARLRRHLLDRLLAQRTQEAIGLYLILVHEPRMRSDALAAVAAMDDPPADLLLAYLDSPQGSLRLAAAQAVSRLSDPAVAEQLCQSLGGIGRQEALIALLLSQSAQAADCLSHARRNIYLMAAVQAAEQKLYSSDIQRGGNLP